MYICVFDVYITVRFHQRTAASFALPYVLDRLSMLRIPEDAGLPQSDQEEGTSRSSLRGCDVDLGRGRLDEDLCVGICWYVGIMSIRSSGFLFGIRLIRSPFTGSYDDD